MGVRTGIAVLAGKATAGLLRLLGRHATTLPGKVALKLSPGLLGDLAAGMDVVLVTGTNGKTTTTHLVAGMCEGSGLEVLTNSGGANMTAGLASAFVADCAGGKPRARAAVLECDEAYAKTAAAALNPRAIIITNLFRDQLDRWGEVTHTQDVLREALVAAPEAVAVLNADDSLVASLAEGRPASAVRFFGLGPAFATSDKGTGHSSDAVPVPLEGITCPRCGGALTFAWRSYGHLGDFRCVACGFSRPAPQVEATALVNEDAEGTAAQVLADGALLRLDLTLPGAFNLYNGLAALACARVLDIGAEEAAGALARIDSSFGRMETFACGDTPVRMILVKNPVGLDRALDYLATAAFPRVFFGLNDKTGDGTDISWIWDADLEGFFAGEDGEGAVAGESDAAPAKPQVIGVFGTRVEDMALRLCYAGAPMDRVTLLDGEGAASGYTAVADSITADPQPVCILANYTAMYDLRTLLGDRFGLRSMS